MEIFDVDPNNLADLIPNSGNANNSKSMQVRFGLEETDVDLTNTRKNVVDDKDKEKVETPTNESTETNTDLLNNKPKEEGEEGEENKDKPTNTQTFKNVSEYFEQRIKDGFITAVNEVDESGNSVPFIPKTPEEFDEVIKIHVDYKLNEKKKEIEQQWYQSKSDAWKAVSQYAEMVNDPTEIIPFLQGVKNIQSVEQLDENEIDGAEQIVRSRLEQRGDPDEVIDSQIEGLKTSGKLVSTAKQLKPLMINEEKQFLVDQVRQRELIEQRRQAEFDDIRTKAIESIEKPIFGKQVLKREEKALIYNLIAEPSDSSEGFPIYEAMDRLYASRDFETLKQIALLLSKKDSFYNYMGIDIADKTAGKLQKKLQAAVDSRPGTSGIQDDPDKPVVQRNKFTGSVRFGR